MDRARAACACLPVLAFAAAATAAQPAWPPSANVETRIDVLRQKLGDASATPAERAGARAELLRLLMNPDAPDARASRTAVPRAAIDPFPAMAPPAPAASRAIAPVSPVASPAKPAPPLADPHGGIIVPVGPNAVDPRTGRLLLEAGNGYVDPATGRFVPRPQRSPE